MRTTTYAFEKMRTIIFKIGYILFVVFTKTTMGQSSDPNQNLIQKNYANLIAKTVNKSQGFSIKNFGQTGSVDKQTGKFGITIPIHKIKTPYFELPIALTYATSGVNLRTVSNEVGINWHLLAGGAITRIVNEHPDELSHGETVNDHTPQYDQGDLLPKEYYDQQFILKKGKRQPWINWPPVSINDASGSAAIYGDGIRATHYINSFPETLFNYDGVRRSGILEILAEKRFYESFNSEFKTDVDTEPDYFNVNVGNHMNFTFVVRRKNSIALQYNTTIAGAVEENTFSDYYEAVPLDAIGFNIKVTSAHLKNYRYGRKKSDGRIYGAYGIRQFEVTDKKGIVYVFDKYDMCDMDQLNEYLYDFQDDFVVKNKRVVQYKHFSTKTSSWKLSRIDLPNGENIQFGYVPNTYLYKKDVPRIHDGEFSGNLYNLNPQKTSYGIDKLDYQYKGYSINEIRYNETKILFDYSNTERLDYMNRKGNSLESIQIFDNLEKKLIRKINLEKTFYKSNNDNHENFRMFLTKLLDSNKEKPVLFFYDRPQALPTRIHIRNHDIFGYYLGVQPNTYPSFPDIYISRDESMGNRISYEIPESDNFFKISGTNRLPKEDYPKRGTMHKIIFPTGGQLHIEYENNTYHDDRLRSKKSMGPGVRVKELRYLDWDNSLAILKTYRYDLFTDSDQSSGKLMYKPSYAYISNWALDNTYNRKEWENFYNYPNNIKGRTAYHKRDDIAYKFTYETLTSSLNLRSDDALRKVVRFSNYALGSQADLFGRELIYTNVEESIVTSSTEPPNSRTRYYYKYADNRGIVKSISSFVDTPNVNYCCWPSTGVWNGFPYFNYDHKIRTSTGMIELEGKEIYPFPDRNFFDNEINASLGEIEKVEYIDATGTILRTEEYEYDYVRKNSENNNLLNSIKTGYLKLHQYDSSSQNKDFWFSYNLLFENYHNANIQQWNGLYFYASNLLRYNSKLGVSRKKETYYDKGKLIKNNLFTYDDQTGNVKEIVTSYLSNGATKKIRFDYPKSTDNDALHALWQRNIIEEPYLIKEYRNGFLVHTLRNEYKYLNNLNIPLLSGMYHEKISGNKYGNIEIKRYNSRDLPVEISKVGGINEIYIYGYNKSKLICRIVNSSYENLLEAIKLLKTESNSLAKIQELSDFDDDRTIDSINHSTGVPMPVGKEGKLRAVFRELRASNRLVDAEVTTYTYDPLIGITSIADPRGEVSYYHYDTFNRLEFIKDSTGNILKEYKYNYKN